MLLASCNDAAITASPRLTSLPAPPQLFFVSLASDETFHRVSVTSLATPSAGTFVTPLSCLRVYLGGSRGLCLTSELRDGHTVWWATIFDGQFHEQARLQVSGEPSRARVSPDGRYAAATFFESGHSYSDRGFSTRTDIFELTTARSMGNLEEYVARRDGQRFSAADFNFWGVTFARDSDRFYATLDTGGVSYLVEGTISQRTLDVLRPGVECPSLSPDNRRIAFKKRVGARSRGWWQLAVLDLDTMTERVISQETRSVDDQVEWLDDERVAYHLTGSGTPADLWTVGADNRTAPERLLPAAYSPAVLR